MSNWYKNRHDTHGKMETHYETHKNFLLAYGTKILGSKVTISRVKNIFTNQHSIDGISAKLTSGDGISFANVTSNTTARATVVGNNGLPAGERYYTMNASSGSISWR